MPAYTLSATDLKALRKADRLSFHHSRGATYIRATLRAWDDENPVFSAVDQRLFPAPDGNTERERAIPCEGHVRGYEPGEVLTTYWHGDERTSAFAMLHSQTDEWRTIAHILRPGDEVTLLFLGDHHSNGYVKDAGLHADVLLLQVERTNGRRMSFIVDASVCADNTARMVRRYGN